MKRTRRKLTPREASIRRRYTATNTQGHRVMLRVDCQSFWLEGESNTKVHAEWTRDMLAIALAKIKP